MYVTIKSKLKMLKLWFYYKLSFFKFYFYIFKHPRATATKRCFTVYTVQACYTVHIHRTRAFSPKQ